MPGNFNERDLLSNPTRKDGKSDAYDIAPTDNPVQDAVNKIAKQMEAEEFARQYPDVVIGLKIRMKAEGYIP